VSSDISLKYNNRYQRRQHIRLDMNTVYPAIRPIKKKKSINYSSCYS